MNSEINNNEKRDKTRFDHISSIRITEMAGTEHRARMFNYSKGGLYFESDSLIEPGTEISINILNPPDDIGKEDCSCLKAEVAWRKDLPEDSYFYFGYGAHYTI